MFESLTSWENLLLAFRKAARGKRGRPDVAAFEHKLEENLAQLMQSLTEGTYRPAQYYCFQIHEPKRRLISAAPFRDRIVHHALCNLIEPILDRSMVSASFANRKGKGTHSALFACRQLARRFHFALQLDIQQFFPSINHAILLDLLQTKVKDLRVVGLIRKILDNHGGSCEACHAGATADPKGLPIGNLTSQLWANFYLNPVDNLILRQLRCPGYVRYVDDLVLFADDKRYLWECKKEVVARLARFALDLHPGAHPKPVEEGLPFLGFVVRPAGLLLKRRKVVEARRRLASQAEKFSRGSLVGALAAAFEGWAAHARSGSTRGLVASLAAELPREVAAMARIRDE